jgi:hypothetical protein
VGAGKYKGLIKTICLVWLVVTGLMVMFLRIHKNSYREEKYERMVTETSQLRKVAGPCDRAILGDPVTAGDNFIKVFFHCGKDREATNSIDLQAVNVENYYELIEEVGRINGFEVKRKVDNEIKLGDYDDEWRCFVDGEYIDDFDEEIKVKSRVECFTGYSNKDIEEYYENE